MHGPEDDARKKADHQAEHGLLEQEQGQLAAHRQGERCGKRDLVGQVADDDGMQGQVQGQHQQQTYLARHHRRAQEGRHRDQGEEPRHAQQQGREVPVDPEFLQKLRKIHACPVRGVSWGHPFRQPYPGLPFRAGRSG